MPEKKAFVFDTNFIIQISRLDEVIKNLKDRFNVYVTQVSIDERIAQQCRELKTKFDTFESIQKKYGEIASIKQTTTYEKRSAEYKNSIQHNYDTAFGDNIIPFNKNEETFTIVLERANQKIPPFSSAENASDKGFKDTLIWISILDFFKSSTESSVVFVSSDNGFKNNADTLCKEFRSVTGKELEIKDNSYYKELLETELPQEMSRKVEKIPDASQLRPRIYATIGALCGVEEEGYWGLKEWVRTFTISEKADEKYVATIFKSLKDNIAQHIFDQDVQASDILGLDKGIRNGNANISLAALEQALSLHGEIMKDFPEYIQQFYAAVANILNQNYIEIQEIITEDDGELPF